MKLLQSFLKEGGLMEADTLPKALVKMVEKYSQKVSMRQKVFGLWEEITWVQYLEKVKFVALGLNALGIKKEDKVAIIGENQPEWLYSALGIMSLGGIFVGVYATNPAPECEYIIDHSGSVIYFCEDEEQLDKALTFRSNTPQLRKIIVWDMEGLRHFKDPMLMSFDELLALGKKICLENPDLFTRLVSQGKATDIASIIYTSGTTGRPKGAMLSHEGYLWVGRQTSDVGNITHNDETISFLPVCHVYEQVFALMVHLTVGHIINMAESPDTIMRDLKDVSPTIFQAVPRIWEKYYSGIVLKMDDASWMNRAAYKIAVNIGSRYNETKLAGKIPPLWLVFCYKLAYLSVFWPLKRVLGFDRLRLGNSAAAPISHKILKYFQSIGIPVREGFGMTETTGTTHMSDENNFKLGTVGKALPGTEVKIAEDGEILIRNKGIFKGYYRDEETTKMALCDGWLRTGDVGEVDAEGYMKITDRKKDLMITAGGKNIAPQFIENLLKFSPYINDAVIIADVRKYVSAIIVIDEENVVNYAQQKKIQYTTFASLTKAEEVIALIQLEINNVNKELARVETIKKFRILDKKLYTEDGEVTPTMKVKRKYINEHYKDLIESMYRE
jgi:long-chain acyl-CoA synthetase